MASAYRRFRLFFFAPWLILVFLVAGCNHLEFGDSKQPPSRTGDATMAPGIEQGDAGLYPLGGRPGGPPPPALDAVRVGIFLPLSGPQANLAQAMLNAAELALFDLGDRQFELLPYDTGGTPEGAAAAAQVALGDGVSLFLGPLLASSVRAMAPIAGEARVPIIAFSSDRTVAEPGVYVLGFTPEAEVRRVLGFAAKNRLKRFAILAPQDAYGNAVVAAAKDAAPGFGASLARIQFYDPGARDFGAAVEGVIRGAGGSLLSQGGVVGRAQASDAPFDALLIADGGDRLRAIGAQLPVHGLQPPQVRILGTGAWDDPDVGAEPALVGGWFAAPAPTYREAFEAQYTEAFGERPPRLATLAYDAAALAAVLGRDPGVDRFNDQAISDPKGFLGRDGIFRFGADGVAERGLAVLEVDRRGNHVISEPPLAFGGS